MRIYHHGDWCSILTKSTDCKRLGCPRMRSLIVLYDALGRSAPCRCSPVSHMMSPVQNQWASSGILGRFNLETQRICCLAWDHCGRSRLNETVRSASVAECRLDTQFEARTCHYIIWNDVWVFGQILLSLDLVSP